MPINIAHPDCGSLRSVCQECAHVHFIHNNSPAYIALVARPISSRISPSNAFQPEAGYKNQITCIADCTSKGHQEKRVCLFTSNFAGDLVLYLSFVHYEHVLLMILFRVLRRECANARFTYHLTFSLSLFHFNEILALMYQPRY